MSQKETKQECNKRKATDCGLTNNDNSPPLKKIKSEPNPSPNSASNKSKSRSGTKRKVALIVSYLGTNYHGSAFSGNNVSTVSSTLFKSICKIGAITEQNAIDPKKVSFSASSRTDKGVHAAAATFALKMINLFEDPQKESILAHSQQKKKKNKKSKNNNDITDNIQQEDTKEQETQKQELINKKYEYSQWNKMKDLLNKTLPYDIKVQAIQRTIKHFDPRFKAWSRVYHYIIPTYLFDSNIKAKHIINIENMFCQSIIEKAKYRQMKKKLKKMNTESDINNENDEYNDEILNMNDDELMKLTKEIVEDNSMKKEDEIKVNNNDKDIRFEYRISDELVNKLKELCQIYIGTRNYHNFTRKMHPKEDRAKRYMYSIEVINSSLIVDGMEYLQFEIHGTSFLYHQIRKMIGLMVTLMRNIRYEFREMDNECMYVYECEKLKQMVFSVDYKMAIPLAPSQGLYLKAVRFDEYNKKCIKDGQEWKQLKIEKFKEGIDKFIMDKILPSITKYEVNENNPLEGNQFAFWLYILDNEFKFEIVKITQELMQKLKEKGMEYVTAGNVHQTIDKFYQKIMNKTKQNNSKI